MIKVWLVLLLCSASAPAQEVMVVVQKHADSVGFYEAESGKLLETIKVGVRPHGIEMSRTGRLYVVADFPPTLLVIDPKEKKILREIPVGQPLPHMVAVTRDERKAYTADAGAGTVTVISLSEGKAVKHISIGGVPMGLALSKDERRLYAVNRTVNNVLLIDTATDEIVKRARVPGQPVRCQLTPDGKHLIVTLIETGEVAVLVAKTLDEVKRFRAGANAEGIGIDPAGRFLYVSAQGENEVIKYSLADWEPVFATSPVSPEPRRAANKWLIGALAAGLLLFLSGWLVGRRASSSNAAPTSAKLAPALEELWRPWLTDGAGATVCFSNPPTAVIKHYAEPVAEGRAASSLIRTGSEDEQRLRQYFDFPPSGHVYVWPDRGQGKIGESIGAVYLANFFGQTGLPLRATQSRYLSWEIFRRENLILLGHHEINSWVATLLEKYPLRVQADESDPNRRIILNTAPAPGEQEKYENVYAGNANQPAKIYALISMLPGVDGRHELLLVNGLESPAAHLGAEFLTNPARAEELLARLRAAAPNKQAPWRFQAVLEAEVRDKAPTQGAIVAFRAL